MTGAVGMITSPVQAEHVLATAQADAVIIAREFLRIHTGHCERPVSWARRCRGLFSISGLALKAHRRAFLWT